MTVPFRFDAGPHHYILEDTGEVAQSITGMLKRVGLVDDRWFDQAGSERGDWVHARTAEFDLGLLERPHLVESPHKPYLLAHVKAVETVRPEILEVEWPHVHSGFRFGGRVDRIVRIRQVRGVWEIKTGDPEKAHQIQTALEAILDSDVSGVPARHTRRWCCYLRDTGRFKMVEHQDPRDFDRAYEVLAQCGLRAA